jgi:hypothetical protein
MLLVPIDCIADPIIHLFFSVCEYYSHLECQDFVVSDCKECATYVPQNENTAVVRCNATVAVVSANSEVLPS